MLNEDIELQDRRSTFEDESYANSIFNDNSSIATTSTGKLVSSALPPVDRGRAAYLFLASATVIEILIWGLPFSIGVLHEYWETVLFPPGTENRDLITLASSLQTGLLYCSGIVFTPILSRYPTHSKKFQIIGLIGAVVGIFGSAFASKPIHLVLSLGVFYPFAGLTYFAAASLLFEWFTERRGLASGILYGGSGSGGAIFPFIMQGLLSKYSYKTSMISLAIGYALVGSIALIYVVPRIPPSRATARARIDWGFLKTSSFWAFTGAITLTSLGNFLPSIYLPSFATDIGLSTSESTLLIVIMNVASIPGLLILGHLSDRCNLRAVILISCLGSSLACLFLWAFAKSMTLLVFFSVFFGASGLAFSAIWTKLISVISNNDPSLPPLLLSIFALGRGLGNITSGPISNALLNYPPINSFGGKYGPLLLYTGLIIAAGAFVGISYREPKKRAVQS